MTRYYTRACNFYYGKNSENLVKSKVTLPLNGNKCISFDEIEIITRKLKKKIKLNKIKYLPTDIKKKITKDVRLISSKKKNFSNLNFKKIPLIMGVLNLTPDSFSDGGKFNSFNNGINHAKKLLREGADIIDIGGESTRPGSKTVNSIEEWNRIKKILNKLKYLNLSLDTRKADIMQKGINLGVNLINDISGLSFDERSINILKQNKTPFVLQHSRGTPDIMQKNPKYKNVVLDIYDFFEDKIKFLRKNGITHNNIILDPGIGFGKNLKHNLKLLQNISIFHSLGFPIMVGISRKRFIGDIAEENDDKKRIGGTLSSSIFSLLQGIQLIRVHDVNEIMQGIKVFKKLLYK
jgi:dihydropteroate synthase